MQARIELRDYDPSWPQLYEREAARIRSVLGERVVRLEHAGSTSVPGLVAKPLIDIVLEVPDAAEEAAYLPAMQAAGFVLRLREPDLVPAPALQGPRHRHQPACVLGTLPRDRPDAVVPGLASRDADDRQLYVRTKRELAGRPWTSVQQYADAKTAVIAAILARAQRGDTP